MTGDARPALCSFSGGKDSCFALWRAQQQGLNVRTLLTMIDESGERSRSHAIPRAVLQKQAHSLGLELITGSASWRSYEQVFTDALRVQRARGCQAAVFGDVDLQEHRDWEEKVCAAAGLEAVLPLWGYDRAALAREIIAAGFRAVLVCVDARWLGPEFCGREYDEAFLNSLPAHVDPCGENGEFHTFVYDGPNFSAPTPYRIDGCVSVVTPPEYGATRHFYAQLA